MVVDNGSTDGTLDVVRELFPQARLIERENLGLASGWNAGMAVVGGRYFLLLNADAWLTTARWPASWSSRTRTPRRRWWGRSC